MSALADLLRQRSQLERQLAQVNDKIDSLTRPQTPRNIKERIKVWKAGLAILDEAGDKAADSHARRVAIKRAFKYVLTHLGGKTVVLGRSLPMWARTLIEEESDRVNDPNIIASTRRKFGHLSVADVKEFKMLMLDERANRGSPTPRKATP